MGLDATGRIGRIIVDPHNPDIVFVAALGACYGPQPERGVFRTKDGGKTWQRVLFVDENTGASEITMDPKDSNTLFAGTWQIDIKTWGRKSGGPGSGVFVTYDGGDTWKRITGHGLPVANPILAHHLHLLSTRFEEFALPDRERDTTQRLDGAEPLAHLDDVDRRRRRWALDHAAAVCMRSATP